MVHIKRTIILLLDKILNLTPSLREWIGLLGIKMQLKQSKKRIYESWILYDACNDDDNDQFFTSVEQALMLLQKYDTRRYLRIQRYIKNIALFLTSHSAYEASTASCILSHTPEVPRIATILSHESTHGYLHSKKFKKKFSYEAETKRHESICAWEEFRTARRLILGLNPKMSNEDKEIKIESWRKYTLDIIRSECWKKNNRDQVRIRYLDDVLLKNEDQ